MAKCIVIFILFIIVGVKPKSTDDKYGSGNKILENPDLFQGDIDYPLPPTSTFRNGILAKYSLWVDNIVPYKFNEYMGFRYTHKQKQTIINALKDMERTLMVNGKKCLTFKPKEREIGHLYFLNDKKSGTCHSPIGRPYSANYISMGPRCLYKGIIQHETMHALGFYHEQSRPDRDEYVTIHWENMDSRSRSQFKKYDSTYVTAYGEPYDYGSILHYGPDLFSKNGKPTITPKKPGVRIGQLEKLSIHDIRKIQKRYGCQVKPLPGETQTTTTAKPTPSSAQVLFSCNFDNGKWCRGIIKEGSPDRWSFTNGGDHTTGSGKAVQFTVRQDEVKDFDRSSVLEIRGERPSGASCLSFRYRVDSAGELKLSGNLVHSGRTSGWQEFKTPVSPSQRLHILVEIRGATYGSVYLDDVQYTLGSC